MSIRFEPMTPTHFLKDTSYIRQMEVDLEEELVAQHFYVTEIKNGFAAGFVKKGTPWLGSLILNSRKVYVTVPIENIQTL